MKKFIISFFCFLIFTPCIQGYSSSDWPMFHRDLQNTGFTNKSVILPLELDWETRVYGTSIEGGIAIENNILYVGDIGGYVYSIDSNTGEIIWEYYIGKPIKTTPCIDQDSIYIGTWDNTAYSIYRNNGTLKWEYISKYPKLDERWGYFINSSPKIYNGIVFIGLNDGYLHAITSDTGQELWSYRTNAPIKCTPAIYENIIFFGSGPSGILHDNNFYAVDIETGKLIWKKELVYDTVSSPAIRDGIIILGCWNIVYALYYSDGREIWKFHLPEGNSIESSPAVSDTTVYICGGNWLLDPPKGALYSIELETGILNWKIGEYFTRITPIVAGDIVFLGCSYPDNAIYAINSTNGEVLWNYNLNRETFSIPTISSGKLLIGTRIPGYIISFKQPYLIIDKTYISDNRCDVNSSQIVALHIKLSYDNSNAAHKKINLNGIEYSSNQTGWVNINTFSNNVGKIDWKTSDIICDVDLVIETENPSIIWDKVKIIVPELQRVNIGGNFEWSGRYLYDSEHFHGSLVLNDALTKNMIGKYGYKVMGILDPKYGLTSFTANYFEVIFDRVNIKVTLSNDRIDVGKEPDITVSAKYEYDSTPFQGSINFIQPLSHPDIGEYDIEVGSINDPLYGLTTLTQNEVKCIWDRIKIVEGGVTEENAKVGNMETVWFKATYEYDGIEFTGQDGVLYVNNVPLSWSSHDRQWKYSTMLDEPGSIVFEVTGIEDNRYGLTVINDEVGPLTITWEIPFLETPVGIISIGGIIVVLVSAAIFFLRKRI